MARASTKCATLVCAVGLISTVVQVALRKRPDFEATIFLWSWIPVAEISWVYPAGLLMVGCGLWMARRSLPRRCLMYAMAGALIIFLASRIYCAREVQYELIRGVADEQGFCRQSTGYTCAPAALVTFLHGRGIAVTEREMAERCGTTAEGTSDWGIMMGLRGKGLDPRIGVGNLAWLRSRPMPCLVSVSLSPTLKHCIMVEGFDGDQIVTIDPLAGRVREARESFVRRWERNAIWCDQ